MRDTERYMRLVIVSMMSIHAMRDTERYWRLLIVSIIEYCTARHRTILETCDCIDDRLLM